MTGLALALAVPSAQALPRCPDGTISSGGGCCAPGAEWSEERRSCMVPTPHDRCLEGDRHACIEAGNWLLSQDSDLAPLAGQLFQLACDHGIPAGCTALGHLHLPEGGLDPDANKAANLFERACHAGNLEGCSDLGELLSSETGHSEEVTGLFAQACHRGYAPACLPYARHALAAQQVIDEAYYYGRACEAGELLACDLLGSALARPGAASRDLRRAEDLYVLACDGGVYAACAHLAALVSCNAGSVDACRELVASIDPSRPPQRRR